MAEFIYVVRPTRIEMLSDGPTAEEAKVLEAHTSYLAGLASLGVVELAGRTQTADPNAFGIVIFKAENEEAAREVMASDPAVAENVMQGELFPYRVAFRGRVSSSESHEASDAAGETV